VETIVASMATIAIEAMTAAMTSGRDDCGLRDMEIIVLGARTKSQGLCPATRDTVATPRPSKSMHLGANVR
jgi:hypothetical protein